MDELMDISFDGRQEKSEEKPDFESKAGVSPKILMFLCVLAVIATIAIWGIFSMRQETEKGAVDLRELESETYLPGDMVDMDINSENS